MRPAGTPAQRGGAAESGQVRALRLGLMITGVLLAAVLAEPLLAAGTAAALAGHQQWANPSQYCGKRSTGTLGGDKNCRLNGFLDRPGCPPQTAL